MFFAGVQTNGWKGRGEQRQVKTSKESLLPQIAIKQEHLRCRYSTAELMQDLVKQKESLLPQIVIK